MVLVGILVLFALVILAVEYLHAKSKKKTQVSNKCFGGDRRCHHNHGADD